MGLSSKPPETLKISFLSISPFATDLYLIQQIEFGIAGVWKEDF